MAKPFNKKSDSRPGRPTGPATRGDQPPKRSNRADFGTPGRADEKAPFSPSKPKFDSSKPKFDSDKPKFERKKPRSEPKAPVVAAEPEIPKELPMFSELGLNDQLLKAISELGFEAPTPIQAEAIPVLLQGRDILGQAQTGTGKTAAFALPLLQRLDREEKCVQALVLAPTRELAIQVAAGIHGFAKHTDFRVVPVYGGQPIDRQLRALRAGSEIVVGTPGRVLDHLRRGSLTLDKVKFCALDEADEMMALGFIDDMESILSELPPENQLALFSATMPPKIAQLTKKFLKNPVHIAIEPKRRTLDTTNQTYYEVPSGKKLEALARVLDMETPGSTIVFCRTRQDTTDIADELRMRGYAAEALNGDMAQTERDRVMRRFREGQAELLIATDVAARGLDIDSVTHVINHDVPWDVEQYIHRIGRTGRAGRSGDAITLVSGREKKQLMFIERAVGAPIRPARIPTAADVAARRRDIFKEELREAISTVDFDAQMGIVQDISQEFDITEVAAAAIHLLWKRSHKHGDEVAAEVEIESERPETGMTRLFLMIGRQDGLRPGDLVGAIANEAGLKSQEIGAIDILDRTAFVEVPSLKAENVVDALMRTKIRNKKVKVQVARPAQFDERTDDRPPRRSRN